MDVEKTLLKIAVSIIALFVIFQGTQDLKDYSLQRSAEIADKAKLANDEKKQQRAWAEKTRILFQQSSLKTKRKITFNTNKCISIKIRNQQAANTIKNGVKDKVLTNKASIWKI